MPANFDALSWKNWEAVRGVLKRGEVGFTFALLGILVMLILPLPKMLLDGALALSLAFSVIILTTVLFLERPLQFSVFPTVLLVATMLRLSLNVASTRLILSSGHEGTEAAGEVIKAFGYFIMRGNFLIGLIIFVILVVINFVVITKGSGRIAEVVARFSLDSLPGKQMAVDADLSSGAIEQAEAKRRRKEIQEETNFYGAMDGAAKFVRGDAIAGVLITFINLVGGVLIGVSQQGLNFGQAVQTYSVLTVGDGLVTQIPALVISMAAGMLISKASSEGTTNQAFGEQLGAYPVALVMSAILMAFLGLLPGVPVLPFFSLAGLIGMGAWWMEQAVRRKEAQKASSLTPEATPAFEQKLTDILPIEPIKLELGVGLLSFVKDPTILVNRVKALRQELTTELGVLVPSIRIVDNMHIDTYTYHFKIKEIDAGSGCVFPDKLFVLSTTGQPIDLQGETGRDPIFGVEGLWISPMHRSAAEQKGYLVTEGPTMIATHLVEALREYLPELFSFSALQQILDLSPKAVQKLYNDIVPNQLPPTHFQRVLQNLLAERVSIRDFDKIVEAIEEGVQVTRQPALLTEFVRSRLARQICARLRNEEGKLRVLTLSSRWDHEFQNAFSGEGENRQFVLSPSRVSEFMEHAQKILDLQGAQFPPPALLVTPGIRPHVRAIFERFRPQQTVISQDELYSKWPLEISGEI